MSEKENRMLDLLGQLPDDILDEAAAVETREEFERLAEPKKRIVMTADRWRHFGVLAACLCVLISAFAWWTSTGIYNGSGEASPGNAAPTAAGGSQMEEGAATAPEAFPTEAPEDAEAGIEELCFGFEGCVYVIADVESSAQGHLEMKVTVLPEGYRLLGSLAWTEEEDPGNMETGIEMLAGCEVYGAAEHSELYVEIDGEYWLFRVK